ncbi:HK97 family phage prohead protease [Erythrobacter aureus]|uniref:HK97 family phage prohead protease n=1 Tax=Erythrobacter aureus TaxID=2182384 RepID=UPI003A8D20C5
MSREHGSPTPWGWPRGGGPTSPASAAHPPPAPPSSEGRPLRIAGYAALFDKVDGARDTIRPGAFARTLAERSGPYPLYWQHRPGRRIGWVETVGEDARGLRIIASIDKAQGRAARLLRTRAVNGLSFGYRARAYRQTPQGRELADIELFEVSVVTHPLQDGARVHFTT